MEVYLDAGPEKGWVATRGLKGWRVGGEKSYEPFNVPKFMAHFFINDLILQQV